MNNKSRTKRLLGAVGAVGMALSMSLMYWAAPASANPTPEGQPGLEVEAGPSTPTSPGSTYGGAVATMPSGESRLWMVVAKSSSAPAYLAEIDPLSSQLLATYPLPSAVTASWGVDVAEDGSVYLGTYPTGTLMRLTYGADEVEDLGRALDTTSYLWRVAIADDGRVVSGTYEGYGANKPPAHVVAWNPADSTWQDYGTLGSQQYVRSVEVVGSTIYAGLGEPAALWAIDMETGEAQQVALPSDVETCKFVYNLSWNGDGLYTHFQTCPAGKNVGYRLDIETNEWDLALGDFAGQDVSTATPEGSTFLVKDGRLQRLDNGVLTATGIQMSYSVGIDWIVDPETGETVVVGGGPGGSNFVYRPSTDQGYLTYPTKFPQTSEVPIVTDHGDIPLRAVTVSGAVTTTMPDGSERIWAVATGIPAYLAEIDPATNTLLRSFPMPGATGGWGITVAPDGSVYTTSYVGGYMYRLAPGADALVNLGRPVSTTSFLWRADTDEQGRVFTGTYEGYGSGLTPAHLVMWDPSTEAWEDYGTFGPQHGYVRTVSVADNQVFVGVGSIEGALFAVDIDTKEHREIPLPEGVSNCAFVYESSVAHGHVFFRFNDCEEGTNIGGVYDIEADAWVGSLGEYAGQDVLEGPDGKVYLATNGKLSIYDTATHKVISTEHSLSSGRGLGYTTNPDTGKERITAIMVDGRTWQYDPVEDTFDISAGAPQGMDGAAIKPRRTAVGPDNRVYVSGYFSGRFAAYDPNSDQWEPFDFAHQTEGMIAHDGLLYMGVYPGAKVFSFDPTKPFGYGNPKQLFSLDGQDRPFAMASAGDYVAIGTVAAYGQSPGAVALYDPKTGDVRKFEGIVGDQSIASLEYHDGILYGGTSIWGGQGAETFATTALIFAMDVESGEMLWVREAPENHAQVPALEMAPDGTLWGITVGTVFTVDPTNGTITRAVEYHPQNWAEMSGQYANMGELYFDETDGFLYGATYGKALRIDPETWANTAPAGMSQGLVVQHPSGAGYWFSGQNLFSAQWRPLVDIDTTAPVTTATTSPQASESGWHTTPVSVTFDAVDEGSGVRLIEYSIDGSAWTTYVEAITLDGDGTHSVDYRATDNALNVEDTRTIAVAIDQVAPVTTAETSEATSADEQIAITLAATDETSGIGGTFYRLDQGDWIQYEDSFDVARLETDQLLEFYSVDVAGNSEAAKSIIIERLTSEPQPGDEYQRTLSADKLRAKPGEKITVNGSDWKPGEQVTLELHSDPLALGEFTVTAEGLLNAVVTIPEAATPGTHHIVATVPGVDQDYRIALEVLPNQSTPDPDPGDPNTPAGSDQIAKSGATLVWGGIAMGSILLLSGVAALAASRKKSSS